jgi:hypothetical protein
MHFNAEVELASIDWAIEMDFKPVLQQREIRPAYMIVKRVFAYLDECGIRFSAWQSRLCKI